LAPPPKHIACFTLSNSEFRTLIHSGFYSKSLTNYFIASNQIVKQLRRPPGEYWLLSKA